MDYILRLLIVERRGVSYKKRVEDINRIYDREVKRGLSNREIWRRYVWPVYGVSERTFYNLLNASGDETKALKEDERQLLIWPEASPLTPPPP